MESILRYFPDLSEIQIKKLTDLQDIYRSWNSRINVISRKDLENFYIHHVLHSLAIARFTNFAGGSRILDVGTGGGFPGIPLAIFFPDSLFFLLDSVGKKIMVVKSVAAETGLKNVFAVRKRIEEEKDQYDFIVARAVTGFSDLVRLIRKNIAPVSRNKLKNGIIALKGGDITSELLSFREDVFVYNIKDFFSEPWFETKKLVYMAL